MPYKCAQPQGKTVCIPEVSVFKSMSAIIQTFNEEGFVIAADGRTTAEDRETVISDSTQKIFNVESVGGMLAMSVFGSPDVDFTNGEQVHLTSEFLKSAEMMCDVQVPDLRSYAVTLCQPVMDVLLRKSGRNLSPDTQTDIGNPDFEPGETICRVLLDGYFNRWWVFT